MTDALIPDDTYLERLVDEVAAELAARGWALAAAESCTGGWIAKCCTDRAGSSGWFVGGVVSYSNEAKRDWLGVEGAALEREGAVSRAVALQMAEGLRLRSRADATVAVTGIAGPDGGTTEKPVGTVWLAWSVGEQPIRAECIAFAGDRDAIRRQTVAHALRGLLDAMRAG